MKVKVLVDLITLFVMICFAILGVATALAVLSETMTEGAGEMLVTLGTPAIIGTALLILWHDK